jgi:hypothetical protein
MEEEVAMVEGTEEEEDVVVAMAEEPPRWTIRLICHQSYKRPFRAMTL